MSTDDRIRATFLLDNLDAVIESLPPECRPGPYVDPAMCTHPPDARFQFQTAPPPRRWYCEVCGSRVDNESPETGRGR